MSLLKFIAVSKFKMDAHRIDGVKYECLLFGMICLTHAVNSYMLHKSVLLPFCLLV